MREYVGTKWDFGHLWSQAITEKRGHRGTIAHEALPGLIVVKLKTGLEPKLFLLCLTRNWELGAHTGTAGKPVKMSFV